MVFLWEGGGLFSYDLRCRHFSTAVFATCGVGFWVFTIATTLTLPKQVRQAHEATNRRIPLCSHQIADMAQMILVYLGTIFKTPEQQVGRENDKTEKIVTYVTLIVGLGTSCPLDRSEGSMLEALADVGQS